MVRDVVATNSMQAIERKGNIPRTNPDAAGEAGLPKRGSLAGISGFVLSAFSIESDVAR
jgi:hypothetical protein